MNVRYISSHFPDEKEFLVYSQSSTKPLHSKRFCKLDIKLIYVTVYLMRVKPCVAT